MRTSLFLRGLAVSCLLGLNAVPLLAQQADAKLMERNIRIQINLLK